MYLYNKLYNIALKIKYLHLRNKTKYYYVRRVPKNVLLEAPDGTQRYFQYPLHEDINSTQSALSKAIARAEELYELHIRSLQRELPDSFTETEVERLALEKLRKLSLKPSSLINKYKNKKHDPRYSDATEWLSDLVTGDIGQLEYSALMVNHAGEHEELYPTLEDKVNVRAADLLIDINAQAPRTLYAMYDKYKELKIGSGIKTKQNQILKDDKSLRDRFTWLDSMLRNTKDMNINSEVQKALHGAARLFANNKLEAGVKPQTIKRQLCVLNDFTKFMEVETGLTFKVRLPNLPSVKHKERQPITIEEQHVLCNHIIQYEATLLETSRLKQSKLDLIYGCICLLELQGGLMASEIARLQDEHIHLDKSSPYLVIAGQTKTNARKRVIPIVVGLDYIKRHIDNTRQWLSKTKGATHSAGLKSFIQRVTGNEKLTAHCLRHGGRYNSYLNNITDTKVAIIFGWSAKSVGSNPNMLRYAAAEIESTDMVRSLSETSRQLNKHLLVYNDKTAKNVVKLNQ